MNIHSLAASLKATLRLASAALVLIFVSNARAQAPAGAPAGATGICKDGTYSTADSKSGACRGHKGVQTWYTTDIPSLPAPGPGKTASAPAPAPKAATPSLPAPATSATPTRSLPAPTPATAPAARPAPTPTPAQNVPSRPVPATAPSVPARPAPSPAVNTPAMPASQPGKTATRPGIADESARLKAGPPAAGGGPGLVWVNTASKVYHCPGSDFYGKTKAGAYMPEADAKAQGDRPNRNKPCS